MEQKMILPLLLVTTLLLSSGVSAKCASDGSLQRNGSQIEFLFVHGACHGAWCWYSVVTELQQAGYKATALDMTSDGRDKTNADTVTSVAQYTRPLTDYLANVSGQVVLVGHSLGGVSITYAMERYPHKISKAIFLAGVMPHNNQSVVDSAPPTALPRIFSDHDVIVNFANGPPTPTSLSTNLTRATYLFYNLSPAEDITLALSLLDKEPYEPLTEVLTLTPANYGSVPRYFIQTDQDHVFFNSEQQFIISQNPPRQTFFLKGSDHSAFFSQTNALVKLLMNIAIHY